jgi:CRP-like cAMP-binding protein
VSPKALPSFDLKSFLTIENEGKTFEEYRKGQLVFVQGAPAEDVLYIHSGMVKLSVNSPRGKEAVIAILEPGDYCGVGCLGGYKVRRSTATALSDCSILRVPKVRIRRLLREKPAFAETFVSFLVSRKMRIEDDLVDLLSNASEKRLARLLLSLANVGQEGKPEQAIPKISQETLAGIVGTTRSRVSFFMNKFRKQGFIEYNGEIKVRSSLLNVILRD